ncbi:YfjI family protein [Sphaerisporangium rhizosphaerae]|uniref:RepB-like DNA primase domain-containing protein n=1 Tax=Sphaerisporangium rhizosphaerae TaxID=2269375 RepID=A0ABW2P3W6_9ACTN
MTNLFDADQVRQALTTLHGGSAGFIHICSTGGWTGGTFTTDTSGLNAAVDYVRGLDAKGKAGIYARVTTLSRPLNPGERGAADLSLAFPGFWTDLDIAGPGHKTSAPLPPNVEEARRIVAESGLPEPTLLIHSGGGLYSWHLLDEPHLITPDTIAVISALSERFQQIVKASAERLGYEYGPVGDLPRVLRIPGTVNRKTKDPRPCFIMEGASGTTYPLAELAPLIFGIPLPEPKTPPAPAAALPFTQPRPVRDAEDGLSPGDDYNARATWDEILINRLGWTKLYTRSGVTYWRHPNATSDVSATTGRNDGDNLWVFSTNTQFEPQRVYDKFGAYTLLTRGSTSPAAFSGAGKELYAQGYGARRDRDDPRDLIVPAVEGNLALATVHQLHPEPQRPMPPAGLTPPVLPEEFWAARPMFGQIRQAAHSRLIAPDGVFGAVLARAAVRIDYRIMLRAIVGRPQPLNVFVALGGLSGGGKGASLDTASELLPFTNVDGHHIREISAGSGEGIVKKFFTRAEKKDDEGRGGGMEWQQTIHGILVRVDEGSMFGPLMKRQGQTTTETLRQAWSGERLGGSYADEDRGQQLAPHTYRLCVLLGIQPEIAGFLFDDTFGGLPQRFLWLAVQAPEMPDLDAIPAYPGRLDWAPPAVDLRGSDRLFVGVGELNRQFVDVAPEVEHEIRVAHLAQVTGRAAADPLDGHANLSRLKVAAILGALDGRIAVSVEDWALAGMVMATSTAVRRWMQARVKATEAESRKARNIAHVEREVMAEDAKANARVVRMAKRAHKYVGQILDAGEKATYRAVNRKFGGTEKDGVNAAIDHALEMDWIRRDGEAFALGESVPR